MQIRNKRTGKIGNLIKTKENRVLVEYDLGNRFHRVWGDAENFEPISANSSEKPRSRILCDTACQHISNHVRHNGLNSLPGFSGALPDGESSWHIAISSTSDKKIALRGTANQQMWIGIMNGSESGDSD